MSIFALDHPLISAKIYEIKKEIEYCCSNFSAVLPLRGQISIGELHLSQSDVFLLPPGDRITLIPSEESVIGVIQFNNRFLLSAIESYEIFQRPHNSQSHITLMDCRGHLEGFLRYYTLHTNTAFTNLYFTFIDRLNALFPAQISGDSSENLPEKGKEIIALVNSRILENLSLNDVANQVSLTPQYLSSFFHKYFGMTFKEYINFKKAELCYPFLVYSDSSDDTIASSVGFASSASMNKVMKSIYDKSCAEIRKDSPLHNETFEIPEEWEIHEVAEYISLDAAPQTPQDESTLNLLPQSIFADAVPPILEEFPTNWKSILNIGQSLYTSDSELRDQIRRFQEDIGFTYVRIMDLLDRTAIHQTKEHNYYGYELVFMILDDLIDQNLIPFIVLGNRFDNEILRDSSAKVLSYADDYQTYYKKLLKLLPAFIRSCCNRYGKARVSTWMFEVTYDFESESSSRQTAWHFIHTFQKISEIIHTYCTAKVGGPGFSCYLPEEDMNNFFQMAKSEQILPEFVTYTVNNIEPSKRGIELPPNGIIMRERTSSISKLIRKHLKDIPIYITEFSLCGHNHNYLNDSAFNACFIMWYIVNNYHLADGFGYYRLSDIGTKSEKSSRLLFGGNGVYNYNGLRKPSYYAFRFLNKTGPVLLANNSGALITARSKYNLQLVMYHCPALSKEACKDPLNEQMLTDDSYAYEPLASKNIDIRIANMEPGRYLVKEYRINHETGNTLKEYSNISGIKDLNENDAECFRYLSHPATRISQNIIGEDQIFRQQIVLHPLEILLLQIDYNRGESDGI